MPESITVQGREIFLQGLENPLNAHPEYRVKFAHEGGKIYFKNCFLCHGDLLDGDGLFGKRFFPQPANLKHSSSIPSKPDSYLYWRIMKGGRGLPKSFQPWDSAMPAWEGQLSEEDVWKVIFFLTETIRNSDNAPTPADPSVGRGEQLYREKCAFCHGIDGKGKGPAAPYTSPRPRNFYKGQYKIRSTPFGKIPTDRDLYNMIANGMPGTTMPSWNHLPEKDLRSLVLYLKTLSKKFRRFVERKKSHKLVVVPEFPPFSIEAYESGKKLFAQNCSGCHGVKGRSDGVSTHKVVDIASDAIWPRNLTKPWAFRRGSTRKDLFMTLRTGLSGTAMPRFSPRVFTDQQIWDIVYYVKTLSPSRKPPLTPLIHAQKINGPLPSDPEDPLWKTAEPHFFPLAGQIIEGEKSFYPTVDWVAVRTLYNEEEIAFSLFWDDPHVDPILSTMTSVTESPAPPLPPELRVAGGEEEKSPPAEPQEFPDAIALQFPVTVSADGEKPYFLNGDQEHPVNLWKWNSNPMGGVEMNARGLNDWTEQPPESQNIFSKAIYRYGRYYLVMKRKRMTPDPENDTQFPTGKHIPIAFNAWDGSQKENGSKKAISSWFELVLE